MITLLLLATSAFAYAPDPLDRPCLAIHRAAGFGDPAARALCSQYMPEEKECLARVWPRVRNWHRVSNICLQVPGDCGDPHPWVGRGGYCYNFPSDPSCQDPGFRFGPHWHW